jgi:hypothetical protein
MAAFIAKYILVLGAISFPGYNPQPIPFNEFSEAAGITCAADMLYEGTAGEVFYNVCSWLSRFF